MPAGRPTDYRPEFCEMIIEYFDVEPYREVGRTKTNKDGSEYTYYEDKANDWPTLAGFAAKIGSHRESLNNWAKQHDEFFDAIKKAKEIQEQILVTNALKGLYNPTFSIFAAKNIFSWKDKQDITSNDETINVNVQMFSRDE